MTWSLKTVRGLAVLTAIAFFLRFWQLGVLPLFGDEAFYLLWLNRPDIAYFDHPAGMAGLLGLSTLIGGWGHWGIRWLSALLSTACVPLAYLVGRQSVSSLGGWVAAVAVTFGPIYIITGRIVYPDALQSFLLLANLLALILLLNGSVRSSVYVLFAASLFLLVNVKLTSYLYLFGAGLFLVGFRRDMFRNRRFILAAGLGLLGILPPLVWNYIHGWTVVRLAFYQGRGFGLPWPGLWPIIRHAVNYVSPPLALLAWIAVPSLIRLPGPPTRLRNNARLLWCLSASLLLPILFSRANSPRNLGLGLLTLIPLVGSTVLMAKALSFSLAQKHRSYPGLPVHAVNCLLGVSILGLVIYGTGTLAAMTGPAVLPHGGAVPAIIDDVVGWPEFVEDLDHPTGYLLFAVDYSIAGQIAYYSGQPVFSSAGQYRLWGIPDFQNAIVMSRHFVQPELIARRLKDDFKRVSARQIWDYRYWGGTKTVNLWYVEGRQVSIEQFLDDLDYLNLMRAAADEAR